MIRLSRQVIGMLGAVFMASTAGGCIFVPNFGPESVHIADSVGAAGSDRPIRIGQSERAAVVKVLGRPDFRTEHELALGYVHRRKAGCWFPFGPGPCGLACGGDYFEEEFLFLEFDRSGILRRTGRNEDEKGWLGFIRVVGDRDVPRVEGDGGGRVAR